MLSNNWRNSILVCTAAIGLAACLPKETSISQDGPPTSPVANNSPPTIGGTPSTQATVGTTWMFQPSATDSDGDALTFSATGLPGWASINPQTGLVHGTPAQGDTGATGSIVVRVSDGEDAASLPAFQITVVASTTPPPPPPPSSAPTISGTPGTSVMAGSSYSFTPIASDADNDMLAFSISEGSKPEWATFSTATGTLAGTPGTEDVGSYPSIVISVSDGTGTASLPAFSITVTPAPVASGTATLQWTPPVENTDGSALSAADLAGYRVYHGTNPSSLNDIRHVSGADSTFYSFDELPAGTHYFAVTAVTITGMESDFSEVGAKTIL